MRVSLTSLTALTLAVSSPILSAVTPTQIVDVLHEFQQDAKDLQSPASKVNGVNGYFILANKGPLADVVSGLHSAVSRAQRVGASLSGTSPVEAGTDADAIYTAYIGFAEAHINLFDILADKARHFNGPLPSDLLGGVPVAGGLKARVGRPVVQALGDVSVVIDGLSGFLVAVTSSRAADLAAQQANIDISLETALTKYRKLCGKDC